jgi:hypothetical protein
LVLAAPYHGIQFGEVFWYCEMPVELYVPHTTGPGIGGLLYEGGCGEGEIKEQRGERMKQSVFKRGL